MHRTDSYAQSDRSLLHWAFGCTGTLGALIGAGFVATGDYGWAWGTGAGLVVWAGFWRWSLACYAPKAVATDEPAKAETVPLDPKTVLSRDPVLAKLGREIEAARRAHKPRKHLYAAQSARVNELLPGGRSA